LNSDDDEKDGDLEDDDTLDGMEVTEEEEDEEDEKTGEKAVEKAVEAAKGNVGEKLEDIADKVIKEEK